MILRFHENENGLALSEVALENNDLSRVIHVVFPGTEFSTDFLENIHRFFPNRGKSGRMVSDGSDFGEMVFPEFPIWFPGQDWTPELLTKFLEDFQAKIDGDEVSDGTRLDVFMFDEETKQVIELAGGVDVVLSEVLASNRAGGFEKIVSDLIVRKP